MECDISGYPAPDAVFIGGHGGRLEEMVSRIYKVLNKGGLIVFNSVSAESCQRFRKAVESLGCNAGLLLRHSKSLGPSAHILTLDEHNPITILKAK